MVAKTLPGYYGSLTAILEARDKSIPLNNTSELLELLNKNGDWTTMLIQDTVGYEVIKVVNFQGNIAIERGLSHTKAKRFPIGSCVMFAPSEELIKTLCCQVDCCENGVDATYGTTAIAPNSVALEVAPNTVVGGVNAVLGEPSGFMLINGKKVPYYE